ncbi:MAG TPA: hypothetical protein VJ890_03335 [Vineibacter sp.]|nr:hypothetical protein [Vineibacter sp.]
MPTLAYLPKREQVLALVAYPYDPAIMTTVPGPPKPMGTPAWPLGYPSLFSYSVPGGIKTVFAATEGFVTGPADPNPHQWFANIVADGFNFQAVAFAGVDPAYEARGGQDSGGIIEFSDLEGRWDSWARILGWDGRTVELWRGKRGAAFSTFIKVAVLTTDGWATLNRAGKSLKLRDRKARLYGTPLVGATYAGTGGIDGDAAAKGRFRPWSVGYVFGVEPFVYDSANLLCQWHSRAVHGVLNLYVGGVAWTNKGDFPDLAALIAAAASWVNGEFGTCNALATVRYGAVPSHPVRLEGQGDKHGGSYASSRFDIVRRLATTTGMLPLQDPAEIDTAAFTALNAADGAECGWHWDGAISVGDALDEIMRGCAGWWDIGLDGKLTVARFEAPSGTPDLVLDATQPLPGEPSMEVDQPPRAKTRVGWQRNYAVLANNQLTGSALASAATQRLFGEPMRWAQAEDTGVRVVHPKATEPEIFGGYRLEAAAQAEANRQQALFGQKLERWSWPAHVDALAPLRNITVRVDNWDRYAFGASRSFRCAGFVAGPRAQTATLMLVG